MQIAHGEIHIWTAELSLAAKNENAYLASFSQDECARATQFRFSIHKQRFIASRGILRQLLGMYLNLSSDKIHFTYNEYKKPSLQTPFFPNLQFNLSHSGDMAVYAFTLGHPIGIDIEKIQETFKQSVAVRYFSNKEKEALMQFPLEDRAKNFYRIWSRKEAMIKALGKGLTTPLPTFSVPITNTSTMAASPKHSNSVPQIERIGMAELENKEWSLISILIRNDYQAALATTQCINKNIKNVHLWDFFNQNQCKAKENVAKLGVTVSRVK